MERPGLNRLKAALQPGDCVKMAALDRLGRSLTEVLELLGWLRENGVEIISLRESFDQDSAMGRAMLHLAIVFAEMEWDLARERTMAGLEQVKSTGKHLGRRKGINRKRAEEIQNMRQRDGLSWSRIATITGLPSSSIRRICTWDLEETAPTAFLWRRIVGTRGCRWGWAEPCCLGNNGQRLRFTRAKYVKTTLADISPCHWG